MSSAEQERPFGCPYCGGIFLYSHGSYEHNLIDWIDGQVICKRILIRRFRCLACGRTVSCLPDDLPPRGQYCRHFISSVLIEYAERDCTVSELCEKYQITSSVLYRWINEQGIPHFLRSSRQLYPERASDNAPPDVTQSMGDDYPFNEKHPTQDENLTP